MPTNLTISTFSLTLHDILNHNPRKTEILKAQRSEITGYFPHFMENTQKTILKHIQNRDH